MNTAFESLVERTVREVLELDPVRATWMGASDSLGSRLPDPTPEGIEREADVLRALHSSYESFHPDSLDPQQRVDRDLALGRLTVQLEQLEARPRWRMMPQAPVEELLSGITVHLLRDCAPPEVRWPGLLGRLQAAPAFLQAAARTLRNPSPGFTESAWLAAEIALQSLPKALDDVCAHLGASALSRSMRQAEEGTLRALREYTEFLRGDLMPHSQGDFRLGGATLRRILRLDYHLPFDLDELVLVGERVYHETLREVRAIAGAIRPGYNWSRLLLELKDDHPEAGELLPVYRKWVESARCFVVDRDLAPLPGEEELRVLETPAFARLRIPHALYIGCGPLGAGGRGIFLVTPPDSSAPPAKQRASLRWHSRHAIPLRAARETYPGRHLQHAMSPRSGRKLRLLFPSPLFTEGWVLYAEEVMTRAGFCGDERIRLLQLCERLLCACRILTDVALHNGQLSTQGAVAFLVRKAKLDRASAVSEVRRCCEYPALPLSCVIGHLLIQDLHQDWQDQPGVDLAPRAFHEALLSHGALPMDLLRREMGLPPVRTGRDLLRGLVPASRRSPPPLPR